MYLYELKMFIERLCDDVIDEWFNVSFIVFFIFIFFLLLD